MKRTMLAVMALCCLTTIVSCSKGQEADLTPTSEITLSVMDETMDMDVQTKATAVTQLPSSLYFSMTTGTLGSAETSKKASTSGTISSGKISTGMYQTATATSYNYYVSDQTITFAAGGSTISASNTTDVIAGKLAASTSTTPSITLDHVFARTGTLTLNTQTGYTISGVSWKIASKAGGTGGTAGTYNIATGGWSGLTALAQQTFTSSTDLYCTPGVYTITVSYTLTLGDYSQSFTKSAEVTLVAGKINSITGTASGGSASGITLSVTLSPWGTNAINATFS